MTSLLFKIITLEFILIALGTMENKFKKIKSIFKQMNSNYLYILNSWGRLMKSLMIMGYVLMELQFFVSAFQKCCLDEGRGITVKNVVMSFGIWFLISFILYIGFGILLTIFSKTVYIIGNVKDAKISTKMMMSFLLLIMFLFFVFGYENEIKENLKFLFGGLVTCYVLNIQILLKIIQNPFCLVEDKKQIKNENRVLIVFSSVFIVLLVIVNMYLLVLWTYFSFDDAYICTTGNGPVTKWKLLYYTIISFTTIGYGDISPAIFESQVVAILIAITSVVCLIIFVSSILSEKKEIFNVNQNKVDDTSHEDIERN